MTTTINASTSSGLVNTADTSGNLALQTAGTTGVYINSSQKVGINTTTTGTTATGDLTLYASGSDYGTTICLSDGGLGGWVQGSTSGSTSAFIGNFKYNPVTPASSYSPYTATGYGINMSAGNGIQFFAANAGVSGGTFTPTERMRIASTGEVLIGKTAGGVTTKGIDLLSTTGAIEQGFTTGEYSVCNTLTGASTWWSIRNQNSEKGSIVINSGSVSYNTTSDYRLKENVTPMTGALDKVAQLKPVNYTWKETGEAANGFIAHELAEVMPDAVTGEKDAVWEDGSVKPQSIDTSFLVATLTAAIQELKAELDATKAEVAALKGTV